MADEVQINGGSAIAKIRHPVGVAVLTLITLGIYGLYWWYQVNREMVDLGKARNAEGLGDNPTTSLLAFFPGGLIIVPPFFSLYNGTQRMKRAQELTTGATPSLNGWIIVILLVHQQVMLPVTDGRLDLGPWQQVFYTEFDGRRPKRLVIKVLGE